MSQVSFPIEHIGFNRTSLCQFERCITNVNGSGPTDIWLFHADIPTLRSDRGEVVVRLDAVWWRHHQRHA